MDDPTRHLDANCTSCKATYGVSVPANLRARVKAAAANREIWMQTHTDTTGHPRFRTDDSLVEWRIMGRAHGDQMLLAEDPNYSTFRLG